MPREYQIAQLLLVAKEQLEYCHTITGYPQKIGKRNFDVIAPKDKFYKSVCNLAFGDSLLIIGSLLDKNNKKAISFWNFDDFPAKKTQELNDLTQKFQDTRLKTIRDQLIAHQDVNNRNNTIPNYRRRGIVDPAIIKSLQEILDEMIKEFYDYTSKFTNPHSPDYFNSSGAKKEVEEVIEEAPPKLTDGFVI